MSPSRPITLSELDALMAATPDPDTRAFVMLAAATGARVNQLRLVRIPDVMDTAARLTGRLLLRRATEKGKTKARSLRIAPRALEHLARWLQHHPCPHGLAYLFPKHRDATQPLTVRTWQRRIRDAAHAAGLEGQITPHSLRKLFGRQVYAAAGLDLAAASQMLGHRNPASTRHYLEIDGDTMDDLSLSVFNDPRDLLC